MRAQTLRPCASYQDQPVLPDIWKTGAVRGMPRPSDRLQCRLQSSPSQEFPR